MLEKLRQPGLQSSHFSHALGRAAICLHEGKVTDAAGELAVALGLAVGYPWPEYQIDLLELLAVVASLHGDHERAGRLVGAAERIRDDIGAHYRFTDQQTWIETAQAACDPNAWTNAVAAGRTLTAAEAVAYAARSHGERRRPTAGWDSLTPTELEVAFLVAEGLTNPQIAERLLMGRATVKTHVSHAFAKLGLTTRTELAAEVLRREKAAATPTPNGPS
jgi:DNA-binding CsgD family transcriptional regulator